MYNEPKTYVKVLANDNSTVVLEKETEQRVAMKETTAYLMTDMLRRAVNESGGTGGRRSIQRDAHCRKNRHHQRQL